MNPASIPNIAIPRSKFLQEFDHATSFLHGDLIPLDCFEVISGDDFAVKKAAVEVIMSTPIAPIMGNIKLKVCAFFVPMRLLWNHTEEFFGANKTSAGPQTTTYYIPRRNIYTDGIGIRSVSHYLGKPVVAKDTASPKTKITAVSVLKERGYWLIASEWYRAQQLSAPFIMQSGDGEPILNNNDGATIGNFAGQYKGFHSEPWIVSKQYDPFTSATISPQYGSAVELPLGSFAPVGVLDQSNLAADQQLDMHVYNSEIGSPTNPVFNPMYGNETSQDTFQGSIVVNLASATAAKINDIRYAFQLQKYLERANFGSRFFEVLAVHYGVTSPDSRLQRPEYLGGKSAPITIRSVLSTADYAASTQTKVGQMGAVSQTFIDISGLFSKGFVEPGYVYIMASTNHERLYSQGVMREDTKRDRFEFYSPEFNNLGDQAIKNKEIYVSGNPVVDDATFGFTGHWDEYRFRKKIVSGLLDPNVSGALDFWTLSEKFTQLPVLSDTFIRENRDCLSRCLVTGATGPDYIADTFIQYEATREMSMYAIPGLIDHFGAL